MNLRTFLYQSNHSGTQRLGKFSLYFFLVLRISNHFGYLCHLYGCFLRMFFSLWQRANALNASFETLYGGQFTFLTQLIIPNYSVILSQLRSTTVSLQTYVLFMCHLLVHYWPGGLEISFNLTLKLASSSWNWSELKIIVDVFCLFMAWKKWWTNSVKKIRVDRMLISSFRFGFFISHISHVFSKMSLTFE